MGNHGGGGRGERAIGVMRGEAELRKKEGIHEETGENKNPDVYREESEPGGCSERPCMTGFKL